MQATTQKENPGQNEEYRIVADALAHLEHILPAQAPIQDFVHHNTLHGYQQLPFDEALAELEAATGISAYLPESQSRVYYREGRINDSDLSVALAHDTKLQPEQVLCSVDGRDIRRKDIYRIALLFDLQPISTSQLNWQIEEMQALELMQSDVPASVRLQLLNATNPGSNPVRQLWESLCQTLNFELTALHPEHLLDINLEQTELWLAGQQHTQAVHDDTRSQANVALTGLFANLGNGISLRGLVQALSGCDVLDAIRPQLVRICATSLDEGVAAWQLPERNRLGLYGAWRGLAAFDLYPFFHELPNLKQTLSELPEDPVAAIILQLQYFEVPQTQWEGYLSRLALELPGWGGMISWRQQHPNYSTENKASIGLADYLAIRLTLDRLWLNQVCGEIWKVKAKIGALQSYFQKNLSEFIVRHQLYQGNLPEYLTHQAEALVVRAGSERSCRGEWQHLADLVTHWENSALADNHPSLSINNGGWRLFRLAQHLGLSEGQIGRLTQNDLLAMLGVVDGFTLRERNKVWLYAYERHYREEFFQAIQANRHRGRWAKRDNRPSAQIVFCMDDREESFRRHLEEFAPSVETLGAAGFFGVAMNYKGLDDSKVTPLCPIVVTPAHEVREQPRVGAENSWLRHRLGLTLNRWLANILHHRSRHNVLLTYLNIIAMAPLTLVGLLAKVFIPKIQLDSMTAIAGLSSGAVKTELAFTATDNTRISTPEHPSLGFTDDEQVKLVAGFLRNTGLTYSFAPLTVLMGHGSGSQNNPHLAAYDCGACSGRHGGPNARVFAAMANRPEVRRSLAQRNIHIPDDTWFIGAEHNTCSEDIVWYDMTDVPQAHLPLLKKFQQQLVHAQQLSAHERCRRLASAPRNPGLAEALAHIQEREADFSQARPELGHATNAAAVIGRRSVTQGAFLDRRVFLISYDATQDPDGAVLEGILLAVGPVGAGINLEYYFSTVNNERLGCGTKVPHNIVGQFAVMEGASSDLRTGLPRQMIEIHEAMRLHILVEAKPAVLEQIYARQESLRELIAGGWVFLSTVDPDSGEISVFERATGFELWQGEETEVPVFANSPECYRGQTLPVSPALIKQPELEEV